MDARTPTIPKMALCIDCADELTEYMLTRAEADGQTSGDTRSLANNECLSLLDALKDNKGLEAVFPSWSRLRHLRDAWYLMNVHIGDFLFQEVSREEAEEVLSRARKVTLRPASTEVWGDYEDAIFSE